MSLPLHMRHCGVLLLCCQTFEWPDCVQPWVAKSIMDDARLTCGMLWPASFWLQQSRWLVTNVNHLG
jgi:hypothetical protein